ncbi:GAF domain-containing protein [uncultured Vagococcus sp.]|uniref:GAF domain-containing protein n=1 Tax=uncultured Vagococcus sp. TaxID=189676 RepID=UPI0028D60B6A|nr:GAF domain-containing protein [uncultured Vagococcus sp.]
MLSTTNEAVQKEIDQIKSILKVDFVGMALATMQPSAKKEIRWRYVSGNLSQRYQKIVLQVGHGFAGIVWRTGRRLLEDHLENKTATELLAYPIAIAEELNSVVVEPIFYKDEVVAVLLVGYREANQLRDTLLNKLNDCTSGLAALVAEQVVN